MDAEAASFHEWVSFFDSDGDRWLVDATFLMSGWGCIWGRGCQGIEPDGDPVDRHGCCSQGAHFTDAEDRDRTLARAGELTDEVWARRGETCEVSDLIVYDDETPDGRTTTVDGACVFHNPNGFEGGAGCAFHLAADAAGDSHVAWKPDVCWQLPLRLDSQLDPNEQTTWLLRGWERADWGVGTEDMPWWCTEDPAAFDHVRPVVETMETELVELCGEDVHAQIRSILLGAGTKAGPASSRPRTSDARSATGANKGRTWLPHPTVRRTEA